MDDYFTQLKKRHRAIRKERPPGIALCTHRALSWVQAAVHCDDREPAFIQFWLPRLYTLRNKFMHSGATWGSQMNRKQLSSAVRILPDFVPEPIRILVENPDVDWGEPQYPPFKSRSHIIITLG